MRVMTEDERHLMDELERLVTREACLAVLDGDQERAQPLMEQSERLRRRLHEDDLAREYQVFDGRQKRADVRLRGGQGV